MMKRFWLTLMTSTLVALMAAAQVARIHIDDFEMTPGDKITVPVMFSNTEESKGLQFYLTLPQGLKMTRAKLTDYSDDLEMQLTNSRLKIDNSYAVIMYTMKQKGFPPDSAAIVNLSFKADKSFAGGEIIIWNAVGATTGNKSIAIGNDTVTVRCKPETLMTQPAGEPFFN